MQFYKLFWVGAKTQLAL